MRSSRMRRQDAAGWHDAAGWRMLTASAVFTGLWTAVSLWFGLRVFGLICLAGTGLGAFIAGYCYRQQVLSSGQPPRFRWLVMKEDLPPERPD